MAFKYKSGTLSATEALKVDGGCLCIKATAFGGVDAVFTLNDGDEINLRDGKQLSLEHTLELDVALIKCISGKIDVLIEYSV